MRKMPELKTELNMKIRVKNVSDAHRLMRVLQRKSFPVDNEIVVFSIKP